jgi:hypothetical protein
MLKHAAQQFVRQLPRVGVRWAFCYGSSLLETGVFQGVNSCLLRGIFNFVSQEVEKKNESFID